MARCIRCGISAWPNKRVCQTCMRKWRAANMAAYMQATTEIGPLTAENHAEVVERIKQIKGAGNG